MSGIEEIRDAASELHERSAVLVEHLVKIGTSLKSTVTNYNSAIGSIESYFLPQARKINLLGQSYVKKQLPDVEPIEAGLRPVTAIPGS